MPVCFCNGQRRIDQIEMSSNNLLEIFARLHTGVDLRDFDQVKCEICNKYLGLSPGFQADRFNICCEECSKSIISQQRNQ